VLEKRCPRNEGVAKKGDEKRWRGKGGREKVARKGVREKVARKGVREKVSEKRWPRKGGGDRRKGGERKGGNTQEKVSHGPARASAVYLLSSTLDVLRYFSKH